MFHIYIFILFKCALSMSKTYFRVELQMQIITKISTRSQTRQKLGLISLFVLSFDMKAIVYLYNKSTIFTGNLPNFCIRKNPF